MFFNVSLMFLFVFIFVYFFIFFHLNSLNFKQNIGTSVRKNIPNFKKHELSSPFLRVVCHCQTRHKNDKETIYFLQKVNLQPWRYTSLLFCHQNIFCILCSCCFICELTNPVDNMTNTPGKFRKTFLFFIFSKQKNINVNNVTG